MKIPADPIFSISDEKQFEQLALDIFRYQAAECNVYEEFVRRLNIMPENIKSIYDIPFIPVEFFKSHQVISGSGEPEILFSSSGTTGMQQSTHVVTDVFIYEKSYKKGFERFYGDIKDYTFLALLPSYLERSGSSLIYMTDGLIEESCQPLSGYFLHNHQELYDTLKALQHSKKPVILIGVTYALLDFAETFNISFPELIVMETGGMKGKRKELIRDELHQILCSAFGVTSIHSEYSMTELLSQAYSKGNGLFSCPPWMKILIRDTNDPLSFLENSQTGGISIIDLANVNSCSFIATQDLGKRYNDDTFEVLGRFDNSDIRGCNLLVG